MAELTKLKCRECGEAMSDPRVEPTQLNVKLPYEVLVDSHVRECANGHRIVSIPRLGPVLKELAQFIANLPRRLVPGEINYLRRHLGWSQKDLAAVMGVDSTTVSKWENGRSPIGKIAERFLRHLAKTGVESVEYEKLNRDGVPQSVQLTGNAVGSRLHVVETNVAVT